MCAMVFEGMSHPTFSVEFNASVRTFMDNFEHMQQQRLHGISWEEYQTLNWEAWVFTAAAVCTRSQNTVRLFLSYPHCILWLFSYLLLSTERNCTVLEVILAWRQMKQTLFLRPHCQRMMTIHCSWKPRKAWMNIDDIAYTVLESVTRECVFPEPWWQENEFLLSRNGKRMWFGEILFTVLKAKKSQAISTRFLLFREAKERQWIHID